MKYRSLFLYFISASLALTPLSGAEHSVQKRIIKAGFFAFDGYHMQAADGTKSGYGYDFLQELSRYTGWNYTYTGYDKSWADMQTMLTNGSIDLVTSAQKTKEREALFSFSDKPIGTSSAILTAKSGDMRFIPGNYRTYNGMRVGLISNSSRNAAFAAFASKCGFTYKPVYFSTLAEMTDALQQGGSIDVILTSNLRTIHNEWILDQFDPSNFYVMVRKNDRMLLKEINSAIDRMNADSPSWQTELWNKYYTADTGEEIAFTSEERDFIKTESEKNTVFTAIVNPDRSPYSYFKNSSAQGIIPEIFAETARRTGLKFRIIQTPDRRTYLETIKKEHIDVRIDSFYNFYEAEQSGFKLTDPYLTVTISRLTKKTQKQEPVSAAVLMYADHTESYKNAVQKHRQVEYYLTTRQCVEAVLNGTCDTTYVYTYTAQNIINEDFRSRLTATLLPQYKVSFALGVSDHNDPRLLTILNKAVKSVNRNFTEQAVLKQTASINRQPSFIEYLYANPQVAFILFWILAALICTLFILIIRQRAMRTIQQKNRELAIASRAKSSFLSRVSHELRTPMNAIVGITAIAGHHTDEPEKIKEYLGKIESSSHVLLSIINDVLDMSAIESNKIRIAHESFSMCKLLAGLTSMYEIQCRNKGIDFSITDTLTDDEVIGDELRINQILINLISNAYKFTERGGKVHVEISEPVRSNGSAVLGFVVSDTGCGMSEDMLRRLFNPFEQENIVTAQKYGGSGLGLAITKNIINLMNGRITVNSGKGQGTSFNVSLPVSYLENSAVSAAESTPKPKLQTAPVHDFKGKRVLLAEDNELNSEIAVELLKMVNMQTDHAEDGQKALELFKSSVPGTYSAVLMDIQMPVMDGITAAKQIRACHHAQSKNIPIIAMTANAYMEDIQHCLDAGMNSHLAKPIEPEKLYTELERFI